MHRVTWKLTIPYVKWRSNRNLLYDSRELKEGLCDNPEGSDREGNGREVREEGYGYTYN